MFYFLCYVTISSKHALSGCFTYQSIVSVRFFLWAWSSYKLARLSKEKLLGQGKSIIFFIQVVDYKWKYVTWLFQFHLHKQPLSDPCYNTKLVLSVKNNQEQKGKIQRWLVPNSESYRKCRNHRHRHNKV